MTQHRVLILSASAGSGHVRAAEALEKVCRANPRISETVNVDSLSYTNKLFRDFYSKFYVQLVQSAPTFLGWWYDTSDDPWKTDKMRLMLDRLNTGPLVRLIKDLQPDITICTHFLPAEIISHLMEKKQIQTNLSIVVTDFDMHAMWLSRSFHRYFVALEETRAHLTMLGMPQDRVSVSGIPVDPVFAECLDPTEIKARHNMKPNVPIILVSAGTYSVAPAERMVRVLRYLRHPAQIVVICGKDEELRRKVLEQVEEACPSHLSFTVLGYSSEMHEWMSAADLLISKPGGLITAEALTRHLPMVIFAPIPGQEERNSDHLLEKGIAIKCNDITTLAYKIDELFDHPTRLKSMRAAARKIAKPYAAFTVVSTLLRERDHEPITVNDEHREVMAEMTRKR